jgi:DNA modification methylase
MACCPEDGLVMDIFFGSGTTGLVAKKLNRNYLGIELNPAYIQIAEKRIET